MLRNARMQDCKIMQECSIMQEWIQECKNARMLNNARIQNAIMQNAIMQNARMENARVHMTCNKDMLIISSMFTLSAFI